MESPLPLSRTHWEHELLTAWSSGFSRSGDAQPPKGGTPYQRRFMEGLDVTSSGRSVSLLLLNTVEFVPARGWHCLRIILAGRSSPGPAQRGRFLQSATSSPGDRHGSPRKSGHAEHRLQGGGVGAEGSQRV